MNSPIEINGTHLITDAITVADANANVQCERVFTFETSEIVSDFPVPGGPINTPVWYDLTAMVSDKYALSVNGVKTRRDVGPRYSQSYVKVAPICETTHFPNW